MAVINFLMFDAILLCLCLVLLVEWQKGHVACKSTLGTCSRYHC